MRKHKDNLERDIGNKETKLDLTDMTVSNDYFRTRWDQ